MIELTEKDQKYIGIEEVYIAEEVEYDNVIEILRKTQVRANERRHMKKLAGIDTSSNLNDEKRKEIKKRIQEHTGLDHPNHLDEYPFEIEFNK